MPDPTASPIFLIDSIGPPLSAVQIDRLSDEVLLPTGQFRLSFAGDTGTEIPWIWKFSEVQGLLQRRIVTGTGETLEEAKLRTYRELRSRDVDCVLSRVTYVDEEPERERRLDEIEEIKWTAFGQPFQDVDDAFRTAAVRALQEGRMICFRGDTNPPQVIAPSRWTSLRLPVSARERSACKANARFLLSGGLPRRLLRFKGQGCKTRADREREAEAGEMLKQILLEYPRPRKKVALGRVKDHYPGLSQNSLNTLWSLHAPDEAKRPGAPKKRMSSDG